MKETEGRKVSLTKFVYGGHPSPYVASEGDGEESIRVSTNPTPKSPYSSTYNKKRTSYGMTAVICLVLFVSLLGIFLRAASIVAKENHLPTTKEEWGQVVGGFLLTWGLPDLHTPWWLDALRDNEGTQPPQDTAQEETSVSPKPLAVVALDMSLHTLGYTHWQGDRGCVPPTLTDMGQLITPQKNKVLVVCSHPYAVYGTGEAFVTQEDFAVSVMPQAVEMIFIVLLIFGKKGLLRL